MSSVDIFYFTGPWACDYCCISHPQSEAFEKMYNEAYERAINKMKEQYVGIGGVGGSGKMVIKVNTDDNVSKFNSILTDMLCTYKDKNTDYGDSFHNTVQKYGLIAALTRMSDKFSRVEQLITSKEDGKVKDESLRDTLIDLASYAIMTSMELDEK